MLAKRFISAYNKIDKRLRSLYNLKSTVSFADAVHRVAPYSGVVRRYESDLLDYARLRNAIVHSSSDDITIAEPHIKTVETIERIERLLCRPPRAADTVAKPAVTFDLRTKLSVAVAKMASGNYSNVPVIDRGEIIGVLTNKLIVEAVAGHIDDATAFIRNTDIADVLKGKGNHYDILPDTATVEEVLARFDANRKLQIVILTEHGLPRGGIKGVVTTGDLVEINRIMEEY